MSLAHDSALAFLLSQHCNEQATHEAAKVEVVVVRNAEPKASKKSAKPSKGEQAAPIHNGPKVFGVAMPDRNTLDAKGFLQACRDAGKRRNDKGIPFTDPKEVRNDLIKAIHAYCGYDVGRDFGSQDSEARAKAQREIRGFTASGPSREEQRAASRSVAGFVAGLPDHKVRSLANLRAREVAAAEAMIEHEKAAHDAKRTTADRLLSQGLADVERERLTQIRADIAAMGF